MSDVTRWVIDRDELLLSDSEVGIIVGGNLMRDPVDVVTHTDHLAALERVRVETLREAWAAVGDRYDWQRNEFAPWGIKPLPDDQRFLDGIEDAIAAIDRLIDATTTPVEES